MNIVLIGMPGCGKTTIGRELAKLLERDFLDTDKMIEEKTGRKTSDIIREDGEPFFRKLERDAVAEAAAGKNRVIATGGGSVLAKENRDALSHNSFVIFLERPLEKLAVKGRPLSVDLHALYQKRLPLYESLCHFRIEICDESAENVCKRIIPRIHNCV